jgi:hypothetical protein
MHTDGRRCEGLQEGGIDFSFCLISEKPVFIRGSKTSYSPDVMPLLMAVAMASPIWPPVLAPYF